jgi:methionyl-tRNA formyltransferase
MRGRSPARASQPPDLVFLNAALRTLDLLPVGISPSKSGAPYTQTLDPSAPGRYATAIAATLLDCMQEPASWANPRRPVILPARPGLEGNASIPERSARVSEPFSVVVFCPQPRSLYTLVVLVLLEQASIPIGGVLIRAMTTERFTQEFRRDGFRLIHKAWRKLVLQSDENADESDQSLSQAARSLGVSGESVRHFAAERRIPCLRVPRFDAPTALEFLQRSHPTYVVFTGGGLISEETISLCGQGIINCHMGVLPQYKGMDVVEWPLLEGVYDQSGATTHLMSRKIDSGPLLMEFRVDPRRYASLGSLRNGIVGRMPALIRDTVVALRRGAIAARPQTTAGRQYFMLHPKLASALPLVFRSFPSAQQRTR